MPAQATVGPVSWEVRVLVDDKAFEMWHIWDEMFAPGFRLQDMAYILNGTSAQFDIRESNDDRLDYWIIRGEPYTHARHEFRPIGYEDDYGWIWFDGYLSRIVIGVDGTDAPETVVSLTAWTDEYGTYVGIWDLAQLLGFSLDWSSFGYSWLLIHDYFVEGADFVISTDTNPPAELPIQSIEFMELMAHLSGAWVDAEHFYSPVIDESVIWPVELYFSQDGHGVRDIGRVSVAPMSRQSILGYGWWYPLSMRTLEDGYVELTVVRQAARAWNISVGNGSDEETIPIIVMHSRIAVDTSQEQIGEILYYAGDTLYRMVRSGGSLRDARHRYYERYVSLRDARRYYAEPYENGGIRLLYVLGSRGLSEDFMVYRSLVYGERGTRIFLQEELSHNDRILFEFVDTTVERGNVYYYSLWRTAWRGEHNIPISEQAWQMRVDVDEVFAVLDLKAAIQDAQELAEFYAYELERIHESLRWARLMVLFTAAVAFVFAVIACVLGYKLYKARN